MVWDMVGTEGPEHQPTCTKFCGWISRRRTLIFPEEVAATNLRPDMGLWSKQRKKVIMIELTVPWEERVEEAHERKAPKYQELQCCKVGTRGLIICQSTWRMLGVVGVKGRRRREVTKRVAEEAERASRWLWVKSTDGEWNPKNLGYSSVWPALLPRLPEWVLL
ncbi:hypothetical protein Bbelb_072820 [Branchiostoma belcheri]|nr:hypothetical protein Bbelb_072820 [Branchiostoma belcheri]